MRRDGSKIERRDHQNKGLITALYLNAKATVNPNSRFQAETNY